MARSSGVGVAQGLPPLAARIGEVKVTEPSSATVATETAIANVRLPGTRQLTREGRYRLLTMKWRASIAFTPGSPLHTISGFPLGRPCRSTNEAPESVEKPTPVREARRKVEGWTTSPVASFHAAMTRAPEA